MKKTKCVEQTRDELDKDHSADNPNMTNKAKMYENPGKISSFNIKTPKQSNQ